MKIIVTGLECSGTRWLASVLEKHFEVSAVFHRSIPELGWPDTRWPDLTGADFIVWIVRYEPFRLNSPIRMQYDQGRPSQFFPPWIYGHCMDLVNRHADKIIFTSYESLVGPLKRPVFADLLKRLGLSQEVSLIDSAQDGNRKYLHDSPNAG